MGKEKGGRWLSHKAKRLLLPNRCRKVAPARAGEGKERTSGVENGKLEKEKGNKTKELKK